MTVESVTYISDLNATYPAAGDAKSEGDDHLRNIKTAVKATFPNVSGAVTPTHTELNYVDGVTSAIQTQLDAKAPAANPTFTGTVTLPSTTSIGSVSDTELGYVNGVTSAIQTQIDSKGAITGQAWTGNHTFPTQTASDNSTKAATTAYVDSAVAAGSSGAMTFVSSQSASSSSAVTFTGLTSGYDYVVLIDGLYASSQVALYARFTTGGGTPDSGSVYNDTAMYGTSSISVASRTGVTTMYVGEMSSSSTSKTAYKVEISNPADTGNSREIRSEGSYFVTTTPYLFSSRGHYRSTTAADGITFIPASGTITAGTFNLYKIKRS